MVLSSKLKALAHPLRLRIVTALAKEGRDMYLNEIANTLGKNNVNIDYAYAFVTTSNLALLIIRVDNVKEAVKVLKEAKIRIVDETEVSKI